MNGHVRQRGKKWYVVLYLGTNADGSKKYKWHPVEGGKKDAERERTRLLHELNTGTYAGPTRMTVEEYLERWLRDYAQPKVAAKTLERYTEIARLHLVPALGRLKLANLKPPHIQDYYTKALKDGRRDGTGGLSGQTVLHHHRLLHKALQQAVKWQYLARNPADGVDPPRPVQQEMVALDEVETARLLKAMEGQSIHDLVLVAVTTGLRRGELLGLRWEDLNLVRGTLSVRRSLEQTKAGLAFKQPKTQKSRRTIRLSAKTVECLRKVKTSQAIEKLALGPAYKDQGLVFCRPDGEPWAPSVVSRRFTDFLSRTKLKKMRFHDLRHTHATLLLKEGVNIKVVSERLGHSSVTITLDRYSHVLPGMQEQVVNALDNVFGVVPEKARTAEGQGMVKEPPQPYLAVV